MLRTLVFVDHSNLEGQMRHLQRLPNQLTLRELLADASEGRHLIDMSIYAALPHKNGDGVQRYHDWLRMQGFNVVSKRQKQLPDGQFKCNLDTELALDALEACMTIRPDILILVSGDGDFAPLCRRARRLGIRVEVASLNHALAAELKGAAHGVIDLSDWASTCNPTGAAPAIGSSDVFSERVL